MTVAVPSRDADGRAVAALLQPSFFVPLLVLIVNDHILKARWGSALTGKLSDVAGLLFFPLLCAALADSALRASGRGGLHRGGFVVAVVVTGVAFASVKLSPAAAEGYSYCLGAMQWPLESVRAALGGSPAPALDPVWVLADPTDLLALPALWLAWRSGRDLFT